MSLLNLSSARKFFLYNGSLDMRKTFNGITGVIRGELGRDPLCGDVFIFFNRTRTQTKLLLWEGDGFAIYNKRLERGSFELPSAQSGQTGEPINWQDLQFILQGVDLRSIKFRKRYNHSQLKSV